MSNPQKVPAVVSAIENHGDGVYSLRFTSERRLPRFKPGQFLHLTLGTFDPSTGFWPESRVFSIATAPAPNEVTIAYSAKGSYTVRMERELVVGSDVWLKFPYGSFIIDEIVGNEGPAVLVAGGTGLTPFISFLEREADAGSQRSIRLFYGVRKPPLILFSSVLEKTQGACPGFDLSLWIEEEQDSAAFPAKKGRLDAQAVIGAHHELNGAPIFLAGPPIMMDIFKNTFKAAGVADEKIIIDEWE